MRVLLLISEAWNDKLHPNNNMTNWFEGMPDVEIATIYASPALPDNGCCKKYFQLSETSMVKSIITPHKAGRSFELNMLNKGVNATVQDYNSSPYSFFKSISGEFVRLIRDLIWKVGRINKEELKKFITDFNPDIIFTQRMGSVKMCRIERIVKSMCNVPMVAYTGDDEYSLHHVNYSPIFWARRFWVRHELKKNMPLYSLFYSMSEEQMDEFRNEFGSSMKFLVKAGDFDREKIHHYVHNPIVITYAGKLYCNRWKTLAMLANCISRTNSQGGNFVLNIYTRDKISKKQNKLLNNDTCSFIKGAVRADELNGIYRDSDILLHVESLDKASGLATKYSFSTKIMECMSSGCAVMAIGKPNQAGCAYLKKQDAAFVASSEPEVVKILDNLAQEKSLIQKYAKKAYECGVKNHQRQHIQEIIKSDFQKLF